MFSLTHRDEPLAVMTAAERLPVLTGDAVDLCPAYGLSSLEGAGD